MLATTAFISCWLLYRQSFSRTPFLTEDNKKRLTFWGFIIQSEGKTKKFNKAFETQNINTPHTPLFNILKSPDPPSPFINWWLVWGGSNYDNKYKHVPVPIYKPLNI